MELTLRKARKLESSILAHRAPNVDTSLSILRAIGMSEEGLQKVLNDTSKASVAAFNTETKLVGIRYRIREAISNANNAFGLSKLMNERSRLQAESGILRRLIQSFKKASPSEIIHYAKKRDLSDNVGLHRGMDYVDTPAFSDETELSALEANVFDTKDRIEEIEDELMGLNSSKKVTLAEEDISFLRELKIVR